MIIKDWKVNQMSREYNGGFIEEINYVERETEKAVLLNITWAYTSNLYRTIHEWIPKSAIMSDEEVQAEMEAQQKRFEKGCEEYNKILSFAKDNKVKGVRQGMRKVTILKKIKEAGLEYVC